MGDFPLTLNPGESVTVVFDAISPDSTGIDFVTNEATGSGMIGTDTFSDSDDAIVYISDLEVDKSDAVSFTFAGDTITYNIDIVNNTAITHHNVVVSDPLPAGTTYVASSTTATVPLAGTYRDEFATAGSYAGTNGTTNWASTPWTETNDTGGAGGGNISVAGGTLNMDGSAARHGYRYEAGKSHRGDVGRADLQCGCLGNYRGGRPLRRGGFRQRRRLVDHAGQPGWHVDERRQDVRYQRVRQWEYPDPLQRDWIHWWWTARRSPRY